jgi:uncharacterized 2Fe-2S/4Fe-4S cluster protein (DUF4445 family)
MPKDGEDPHTARGKSGTCNLFCIRRMADDIHRGVLNIRLAPPTLKDNTADAERVLGALRQRVAGGRVRADNALLAFLPAMLRDSQYALRCILCPDQEDWQLCGVTALDDPDPILGLAVDLGTTRIVFSLIDLQTGKELEEGAFDNPQIEVGPDVLTRIHYADRPGGLQHLNRVVVAALNRQVGRACSRLKTRPERIYRAALAGNTAMTHFFLGLDPHGMIREPYIPAVNCPGLIRARDLGLEIAAAARLYVFPNVGSYFGGDLVAGILHSGLHQAEATALLVDVGTNAEVVLGNRQWLIACAGAAGPALESGVSRIGTTAQPGAIDRVRIEGADRRFAWHTIDDLPPMGICGSGVIELAAQLYRAGMIDIRGRLIPQTCGARLQSNAEEAQLVLVPAEASAAGRALTFGQIELDSLIRSKAAMYTILETLTAAVGMTLHDLDTIYVAGTFGCFIDPQAAITIGMLPDLPLECYRPLGNSSLAGAKRILCAPAEMAVVEAIRSRITYLELNVNQDFMNRFSAAKFIPHTNPELFPSVPRPAWGP